MDEASDVAMSDVPSCCNDEDGVMSAAESEQELTSSHVVAMSHGMTEVASAPALLAMTPDSYDDDVSVACSNKPTLSDAFYFYQGERLLSLELQ